MSVYLSDVNPNDTCGGGGCVVCGSTKNPDQRGPFAIVVNDNEMESNVSPNVVVCVTCLRELNSAFEAEALAAREVAAVQEAEGITVVSIVPPDEDEEVPSL